MVDYMLISPKDSPDLKLETGKSNSNSKSFFVTQT